MAQPVAAARPPVVTAVVAIMLMVAAAGLAITVGLLVAAGSFRDRYDDLVQHTEARPADTRQVGQLIRGWMGALAVATVLIAVVTVLLALGIFRRSGSARITTWVLAGVGLLCGCGQGISAVGAVSDITYSGDPERIDVASQVTRAVQDALPGWLGGLVGGAAAVQILGYILVAVLLGLPPANRWFRVTGQPPPAVSGVAPWPPPQYPLNPPPVR